MSKFITGLDIGSSQIKCVIAEEKKDGSFSIVAAFKEPSAGVRKGLITDVEQATQVLRNVARDIQKISKAAAKNIFVNVNSEYVQSRISRGTTLISQSDQEIQADDVERVDEHSARALKLSSNHMILHKIAREYFIDDIGGIYDPLGMTGNKLEVNALVVEAFTPHVNTLLKNLERVGIRIAGMIFNPLAASESVLTKKQKELGVLMIDFGFGTTSIAVYEEGKIMHAKSLPLGVGYVTSDIAIGLKTHIDAAEKMKLRYGFAMSHEVSRKDVVKLAEFDSANTNEISRRFLSEIIEIRLAEILDLVNNELKVLGHRAELPAGVMMTGGGVKLAGMEDLVKEELKLPARVAFPNLANFEILNPANRELVEDPEFSCALGLVLGGKTNPGSVSQSRLRSFLRNLIP
ncbi:MAG: cell division protein FtsA [Patescibacteria group bacterium]